MRTTALFILTAVIMVLLAGCSQTKKSDTPETWSDQQQVPEQNKPKLPLEALMELAEKGEDLTWTDFEQYAYEDVGSGLVVLHYDINDEYYLLVGGPGPVWYMYLVSAENPDDRIDIRTESIEDFINR